MLSVEPKFVMLNWRSLWLTVLLLSPQVLCENVIVPGATWTDTSGNVIQAHGAGILKVIIAIDWVAAS